jgi:hypothetical protein
MISDLLVVTSKRRASPSSFVYKNSVSEKEKCRILGEDIKKLNYHNKSWILETYQNIINFVKTKRFYILCTFHNDFGFTFINMIMCFEVITPMKMLILVLWVVMPYSLAGGYKCFEGMYHLVL